MFSPTQSRTLSVVCDAFPVERGRQVLFPVRLQGTEALGKLYRYTLDMATTYSPTITRLAPASNVVLEKLVGKEVAISIEFDGKGRLPFGVASYGDAVNVGAGVRKISGIISKAELTGADDRHFYYRLVVRPALWLTTKTSRSRIFQNQNVLDIDEEYISGLKRANRITTAKVSVVDYDYTRGRQQLVEDHDAFGDLHKAEERHWGDFSQPLAGSRGLSGQPNRYLEEARYLAGVRAYALYSRNSRLRGRGNLPGLKTGRTFFLTDYPEPMLNAEYLVVSTTVDIHNASGSTKSAGKRDEHQFQCVTDFVLHLSSDNAEHA